MKPRMDPLRLLEKVARRSFYSHYTSGKSDGDSENHSDSENDNEYLPAHSSREKLLQTPCALIPPRIIPSLSPSTSRRTCLIPKRSESHSESTSGTHSETVSENNSENDSENDSDTDNKEETQPLITITRQHAITETELEIFCSFIQEDLLQRPVGFHENEDKNQDENKDENKDEDQDNIICRAIQKRMENSSVSLNDNTAHMYQTLHTIYALFKEYGLTCSFLKEIRHCPLLVLWFVQSLNTLPHCVYEYYVNQKASVPTNAQDPAKIFTENLKYVLGMARCIAALSCYTKTTLEESAVTLHYILAEHKTELHHNAKKTNHLDDQYDTISFDKWKRNGKIIHDTTPCAIAYQYSILYGKDYDGLVKKFDYYLNGQIPRIDLTKFPIDEAPTRKENRIKGYHRRS